MHDPSVSTRLGEASLAHAAWANGSPETAALEQHASEGCSVCARALVNARELAVDLAASGRAVAPDERLRSTLLDRTRATLAARRAAAAGRPEARPRAMDPSTIVAHKHIVAPGEPARVQEIDALRATELRPGEGTERMLGQLACFLDFSVFFVSIVRGERAVYRAQRGLPESLRVFRELRREMSYCTHCVSANAPLLVENATKEPFFRGNKAATRFGVAAYAGVPLRAATGVTLGTLCALDFAPRAIAPGTAAVLEVFARRAVAEIERERTPSMLADVLLASSDRADVYSRSFFLDLVAAERSRPTAPGRTALLVVRAGDAAEVLGLVGEHETAGHIEGSTFGVLLPGVGRDAAAARFSRLRDAAGPGAIAVSIAPDASVTTSDWLATASRPPR
jgi:hypothetical protein